MMSLAMASEYWGGGGYLLLPYDSTTGLVPEAFATVVRAYDPDHVVLAQFPLTVWDDILPGGVHINGPRDGAERLQALHAMSPEAEEIAKAGRAQVSGWCSPMRVSYMEREPATETMYQLRSDPVDAGTLIPAPITDSLVRLAASGTWRSKESLTAAMLVGVATSEPTARPEPDSGVLRWLIDRTGSPGSLRWSLGATALSEGEEPLPWFQAEQNLERATTGYSLDAGAVVVGDSASDFALALAYDRMLGFGLWLPTDWLSDDNLMGRTIAPALRTRNRNAERQGKRIFVTSRSIDAQGLEAACARLRDPRVDVMINGERFQQGNDRGGLVVGDSDFSNGIGRLLIDEHVGAPVSLPFASEPDGSLLAETELVAPVPNKLLLDRFDFRLPYWYVDVSLNDDFVPSGRNLSGKVLTHASGFDRVNVRRSVSGYSYDSTSMGLVMAGTYVVSRLARPRLRRLSMLAWLRGMASGAGLLVDVSMPGRHADLLAGRLGSRSALVDLVAGQAHPFLRAFASMPPRSEGQPDYVRIRGDAFLTYNQMLAIAPGLSSDEMTGVVDRLTETRILRRGFVLGCEECGRPSFMPVDGLSQAYECSQCGGGNQLISARWKSDGNEPKWFYDLHPAFRELLRTRSDLVLLASAALTRNARRHVDIAEVEFTDEGSGERVAEIDLVAHVDGTLVISEVKAGAKFGTQAERNGRIGKLVRIAEVLKADRIVLATEQAEWTLADVDALTKRARREFGSAVKVGVLPNLAHGAI